MPCHLQDGGEGRRLGTLVVWLDDGIAADEPLLAVPINLSVLLDLPQDKVLSFLNIRCCVGDVGVSYPLL